MDLPRWNDFLVSLQGRQQGGALNLTKEFAPFAAAVKKLPEDERIQLLFHAYDRYRELTASCGAPTRDRFEVSCYSILISTILNSGIHPNASDALTILRKSFHCCGHGGDVASPLELAEEAFHNLPYTEEFFDAVAAYRETLGGLRTVTAQNLKRKLDAILWHDARRVEKKCFTSHIQTAIHGMDSEERFAWQRMFRHSATGLHAAPGKAWVKEGKQRLSRVGDAKFLERLDAWFQFPEKATLSPAGSTMLRLLIWYGGLLDTEQSLPILARFATAHWIKAEPAQKVAAALAWMLTTHGRSEEHTSELQSH